MIELIFFDFEVFKYDWLACFINSENKHMFIINDYSLLRKFYEKHKENIFVGYNCRHYDQFIFKGILLGYNPYEISKFIIEQNENGYNYSKDFNKIKLYTYDTMLKQIGLKTLEGFMGYSIKESNISFNINRPLTGREIKESCEYCKYDVEKTIDVFNKQKEEYDSHMLLIDMFEAPLRYINNSIANVSVSIFGATYQNKILYHDEFDLNLPELPTLQKYRCVRDWFSNVENHKYKYKKTTSKGTLKEVKNEFELMIADILHIFGFGGVHASKDHSIFAGIIVHADVEGYYPNLMTIYKTLSRNIPNLDEVIRVIKRRLEYKEINDKRQLPLKRALNSLYGKSKDKTSSAYDPRQANRTCIYGQLFLLDLIEMIEDRITLINTNTDGLIFKVESIKDLEELKKICKIWEDRTRFKLGYKIYSKIIQKDVNNYILIKNKNEYDIVNTTDKVDIKSKGTYVKKLNDLDNDLPVVNKAVVDFFVKDIPVEFTILECNELIQFQQICKVSNKYICAMHNNKRLKERIFRTYAVNSDGHTLFKLKELIREEDQFHTIFKTTDSNINMIDLAEQMDVIAMEIKKNNKGKYVKISPQYAQKRYIDYINGYRIEKVQNTPINCIIYNDDVRNKQIFNNLDKDWYIALAKTRIHDFIIGKNKKKVVDVNAT